MNEYEYGLGRYGISHREVLSAERRSVRKLFDTRVGSLFATQADFVEVATLPDGHIEERLELVHPGLTGGEVLFRAYRHDGRDAELAVIFGSGKNNPDNFVSHVIRPDAQGVVRQEDVDLDSLGTPKKPIGLGQTRYVLRLAESADVPPIPFDKLDEDHVLRINTRDVTTPEDSRAAVEIVRPAVEKSFQGVDSQFLSKTRDGEDVWSKGGVTVYRGYTGEPLAKQVPSEPFVKITRSSKVSDGKKDVTLMYAVQKEAGYQFVGKRVEEQVLKTPGISIKQTTETKTFLGVDDARNVRTAILKGIK